MGYAVYEVNHGRWGGYGVPTVCEKPGCDEEIDRGLSHICGEVRSDQFGCGLYFCEKHLWYRKPRGEAQSYQNCYRCMHYKPAYKPKPEHPEWMRHLIRHESWEQWREENPETVAEFRLALRKLSEEKKAAR